jgi:hypothetical protein
MPWNGGGGGGWGATGVALLPARSGICFTSFAPGAGLSPTTIRPSGMIDW